MGSSKPLDHVNKYSLSPRPTPLMTKLTFCISYLPWWYIVCHTSLRSGHVYFSNTVFCMSWGFLMCTCLCVCVWIYTCLGAFFYSATFLIATVYHWIQSDAKQYPWLYQTVFLKASNWSCLILPPHIITSEDDIRYYGESEFIHVT